MFDKLRAADMLTVQWVDRLRRNYDVCATIRAFMDRGVITRAVINNFTFDGATTDPMQKAVREATGFMAATAQAPAEATKGSQRAGIEHAKGRSDSPYLGHKPAFTRAQFNTVRIILGQGIHIAQIAKATGAKRPTVHRLKADPAAEEAALATWGL